MNGSARLRSVPHGFDPGNLLAIDDVLAGLVQNKHIVVGLAVESGSRAWGFPSPDSDYDVRFIYVRRQDDYLSPWQGRDVLELPPEGDLDVNGWDLGKTLKLLTKGNAVAVEWLMSPIVYDGDAGFRDDLAAFAARFADRAGVARHYLHLGERQRRTYFADGKHVHLKKLFYALRPAAALRWLRLHPGDAIAPMHFPTLMLGCDPPAEVRTITVDLIARKAETRELGTAPLPDAIEAFIDAEFAMVRETLPTHPARLTAEAKFAADELFRSSLRRLGRNGSTPVSPGASTNA